MLRRRAVSALGRHHPGHHGHRDRAADPRRPGHRQPRSRQHRDNAGRAGQHAPHDRHGRPHASAAGTADHVRAQGCGLAVDDPAPPSASRGTDAARAGRPVLRRCGHARLARHARPCRPRCADAGAWIGFSTDRLACGARQHRGNGRFSGAGDGITGQDRHRHFSVDADRSRRSVRAVRAGPRFIQHHAAEAEPDFLRVDHCRREGRPPAGRADARCRARGSRARDRTVAPGMDRRAAKLPGDSRRAASGR